MKFILPALLVLAFSSCISVKFNDNYYTSLHEEQRKSLKQFSLAATDEPRDQKSQLSLVEITGPDIKACCEKYPYTFVYLWKPYCTGTNCKPLFYYERIEKKLRDRGVKFMIVSEAYQYDLVKGNTERSTYDRDLYVIKDAAYGHNRNKAEKKVLKEILPAEHGDNNTTGRYLIFKKDALVYRGHEMSEHIMDSVISKYQ